MIADNEDDIFSVYKAFKIHYFSKKCLFIISVITNIDMKFVLKEYMFSFKTRHR